MSIHARTISTNWHIINLKKKLKFSSIEKLCGLTQIEPQLCKLAYEKLLQGQAEFTRDELNPFIPNSDLFFASEQIRTSREIFTSFVQSPASTSPPHLNKS